MGVGLGGRLGTFVCCLTGLLIREDKSYEEHKNLIESGICYYISKRNKSIRTIT